MTRSAISATKSLKRQSEKVRMSNTSAPSSCKAWQYSSTKGGLERNLAINDKARTPVPKPNQHLVQVIAAAINPVDYKPAEVQLLSYFAIPKPATPGVDFAGRIVTPASGSTLEPNQLVFGMAGTASPFAAGALAQFVLVSEEGIARIPEGVDPINTATIGVAGITAYQAITPHVKPGSNIFINGGSGGTGVFGIQIAKALGCRVATTCSTANVELCKSLGADVVVDYRKENVVDALKASGYVFDHVVDNVCSDLDLFWRCHKYTRPGAIYMQVAGSPTFRFMLDSLKMSLWPSFLGGGKRKPVVFFANPKSDELQQIATWMQEGKIKPVIDERFPFEKAPDAIKKLKLGRTKGKIVIDVPQPGA